MKYFFKLQESCTPCSLRQHRYIWTTFRGKIPMFDIGWIVVNNKQQRYHKFENTHTFWPQVFLKSDMYFFPRFFSPFVMLVVAPYWRVCLPWGYLYLLRVLPTMLAILHNSMYVHHYCLNFYPIAAICRRGVDPSADLDTEKVTTGHWHPWSAAILRRPYCILHDVIVSGDIIICKVWQLCLGS